MSIKNPRCMVFQLLCRLYSLESRVSHLFCVFVFLYDILCVILQICWYGRLLMKEGGKHWRTIVICFFVCFFTRSASDRSSHGDIYRHGEQEGHLRRMWVFFQMRENGRQTPSSSLFPSKCFLFSKLKLYSIHTHVVWTYSSMLKIHS